jgi:hypothetical protein
MTLCPRLSGLIYLSRHGGHPSLSTNLLKFSLLSLTSSFVKPFFQSPSLSKCKLHKYSNRNCGGKSMISPFRLSSIHSDAVFQSAAVFSASSLVACRLAFPSSSTGTKYRYICVEKRFGTFGGVIQCVNGIKFSVSRWACADWCFSQVLKRTFSEWMALRPRRRSLAETEMRPEVGPSRARRMPLSSNSSLIAPVRYARLSLCRSTPEGGILPSAGDRLPPGKTWADGKADEVRTRWMRRIWFEGEMRIMLEGDGKVSIAGFEDCPRVVWGGGSNGDEMLPRARIRHSGRPTRLLVVSPRNIRHLLGTAGRVRQGGCSERIWRPVSRHGCV